MAKSKHYGGESSIQFKDSSEDKTDNAEVAKVEEVIDENKVADNTNENEKTYEDKKEADGEPGMTSSQNETRSSTPG